MATLGMGLVKVGALGLKSWVEITTSVSMQGMSATCALSNLKLKAMLVHSDFTKNPSKVISLNFHRVLYLPPEAEGNDKASRIVLREQAIYEKTGISPLNLDTSKLLSGSVSNPGGDKAVPHESGGPQAGSINAVLQEQAQT